MRQPLAVALQVLLLACCSYSQGIITTIAGTDFTFPRDPLPGPSAPLGNILSTAVDGKGNVYVADPDNSLVLRISPSGTLSIAAGNGIYGHSGDGGLATSAALMTPQGVAVDTAGNLYIADKLDNRVRKVTPDGIISTIAGNGGNTLGDGGLATDAAVTSPESVAVDAAGNLYISSEIRIRKVSGGIITTIAGNGTRATAGDGPALSVPIAASGIAVDSSGNVYFAEPFNAKVKKVSGGKVTTIAGNGISGVFIEGAAPLNSPLLFPSAIALDAAGNIFIADIFPLKISNGKLVSVAGKSTGFAGDGGPALDASLNSPKGLAVDAAGNVYIADTFNKRVRKVAAQTGLISTFAGSGASRFAGDGGPATSAVLGNAFGVAVDKSGGVFIADLGNYRIRTIRDGIISTVIGTGVPDSQSGPTAPAASIPLFGPEGIALDAADNLYIADESALYKIANSLSTRLATANGNTNINSVAVDNAGTVYATDRGEHNLYRISAQGISRIAGTGQGGYSGEGPASAAQLNGPSGVAVDAAGNIYIADTLNQRVRKISNGTISTVAGPGVPGVLGDGGSALNGRLRQPYGLAIDGAGDLYISDLLDDRIRKVSHGIITTVAGNGTGDSTGDGGLATQASLSGPRGITFDRAGNLYIAEGDRVRKVLVSAPTADVSSTQLQFSASSKGAIPPVQNLSFSGTIPGIQFSARSNTSWLRISPQDGVSPRVIEVTADPTTLQPATYPATITIDSPNATPKTRTVSVSFTVGPELAPILTLDKENLSFPFPKDGTPRSQPLTITNSGGGSLAFTATTQTVTGGAWLTVTPSSGRVTPSFPLGLSVTASPVGLPAGTYRGSIRVASGAAATKTVSVTMTVSTIAQAILLSQSGMSFLGVAQGGVIPAQTFGVINIGTGVVNWTVSKSVLSGNPAWLQIGTTSGSTDASAASVPSVSVSVNASILAPGDYYGLVQVEAPNAANSPQVLTVFLRVLPAGAEVGAVVQPAELVFSTTGNVGSQEAALYNLTATPRSFRTSLSADPGLQIVVRPKDGTLNPQQPTRLVIQPFTDGLAPGVYNATMTFQFSDGTVRGLRVSVVVAAAGKFSSGAERDSGGVCEPKTLLQALTALGQSFTITAGAPVALAVDVRDDCGTPLESGSVSVSFSNNDESAQLLPLKGGRWEGTWKTKAKNASQVTLKLDASDATGTLHGEREVRGLADAAAGAPVFDRSSVAMVNSAEQYAPLAPGAVFAIYGENLAPAVQSFSTAPLPQTLQSTLVTMSGHALPLYYVSPSQINAQVPFDLNLNTSHQIYVTKGVTQSQPISVDVGPSQPVILAVASPRPAGTPLQSGDVLVLYSLGLGLVNPAVLTGVAASLTTISNITGTAKVTMGDKDATVAFAGLAPGYVGLYQVNVIVPTGVTGASVPVTISMSGQTSPPATISIR